MIITIDGPVASGKSSVAKALAKRLGYYYLYTGLLYRAVAYLLQQQGTNTEILFERDLDCVNDLSYSYINGAPTISFRGNDITRYLSDNEIAQLASKISEKPIVRQALLPIQQDIANRYDIIADGRDCGSVVFPNAAHKFYLTASVVERVKRLHGDKTRGSSAVLSEKLQAELEERDKRDKERSASPLIIPANAIVIDNSDMTLQETIDAFLQKLGSKAR